MTRITAIAMLALLSSAAAADDQHKAPGKRIECEKRDPAKPRQPGLLKFEDLGLCQESQRAPPPWEHCGDCGMMRRWDDRLQIVAPAGAMTGHNKPPWRKAAVILTIIAAVAVGAWTLWYLLIYWGLAW